jgi:hypothetical protein
MLLHDVFDMSHAEIAKLLDKSDAACRQLLETSREEHRRLVLAFRDGTPFAAILVSVAEGKVRHVFMQVHPERLKHLGPLGS